MHLSIGRKRQHPSGAGDVESDVVQLLRQRTPLVDDPAGRAMVRTRIEQMAARPRQRRSPWRRGALAMTPIVLLAVALAASLPRTDRMVIPPAATATATAADVAQVVLPAAAPPDVTASPRQRLPIQPDDSYPAYGPPGRHPSDQFRPPRPEVQLPTRAQAAVLIRQVPAPGALALMQEMQRRQYTG